MYVGLTAAYSFSLTIPNLRPRPGSIREKVLDLFSLLFYKPLYIFVSSKYSSTLLYYLQIKSGAQNKMYDIIMDANCLILLQKEIKNKHNFKSKLLCALGYTPLPKLYKLHGIIILFYIIV